MKLVPQWDQRKFLDKCFATVVMVVMNKVNLYHGDKREWRLGEGEVSQAASWAVKGK